jgi:predicted Zn-dependent protease
MVGRGTILVLGALISILLDAGLALSETITVATGITVSRRDFEAPVNEVPFYGFRAKTPEQLAADAKLLAEVDSSVGRPAGVQRLFDLAAKALSSGDAATAAMRLNQAYLLSPGEARVYSGLAAVVALRFNDPQYADELFQIAQRLNPADPQTLHDYSRFLLIQRRPSEALPLLEKLVQHPKSAAQQWSNLGFAYAMTGDMKKACASAHRAEQMTPDANTLRDLVILNQSASCSAK